MRKNWECKDGIIVHRSSSWSSCKQVRMATNYCCRGSQVSSFACTESKQCANNLSANCCKEVYTGLWLPLVYFVGIKLCSAPKGEKPCMPHTVTNCRAAVTWRRCYRQHATSSRQPQRRATSNPRSATVGSTTSQSVAEAVTVATSRRRSRLQLLSSTANKAARRLTDLLTQCRRSFSLLKARMISYRLRSTLMVRFCRISI